MRRHIGSVYPDICFVVSGTLASILCTSSELRRHEAEISPTSRLSNDLRDKGIKLDSETETSPPFLILSNV